MLRYLLGLAIGLSLVNCGTADAAWPWGMQYGWGNAGWVANGWGPTSLGYTPPPPYYSVHPPVYYSPTIVRRAYGTSPYAWPAVHPHGAVSTPPAHAEHWEAAPMPQMIVNPFVPNSATWSPPSTAAAVAASLQAPPMVKPAVDALPAPPGVTPRPIAPPPPK
jgi:hypothetical protein